MNLQQTRDCRFSGIRQEKADPSEIEALRGLLHAADPRNQTAESVQIRKTILDGLDPKFVGRLFFHEHNWDASDRIAQTHLRKHHLTPRWLTDALQHAK